MTRLIGTLRIGDVVKPMRSPVQNLMYLLNGAFQEAQNANVVDTGNVVRTCGAYMQTGVHMGWFANSAVAAGNDSWGILVGSNATAVAINDYKLNTKIAHGTGAGQLKYSAQGGVAGLSSGSNRFFRMSRYFTNDSGGDVTIREVGMVLQPIGAYPTSYYVLICRDLTGDIVVSNTNAVPVEITWQVTA